MLVLPGESPWTMARRLVRMMALATVGCETMTSRGVSRQVDDHRLVDADRDALVGAVGRPAETWR